MDKVYLGMAAAAGCALYYVFHYKKDRKGVLNPREKLTLKLIEKEVITHDVRRYRFALPKPDDTLGLPICKHMFVSTTIDGKLVSRPYTPVSCDEDKGYVDLVLKIYPPAPPRFPDGGALSQYVDSLDIGDSLQFRGPIGKVEYKGRGSFEIAGRNEVVKKKVKHIGMLAGGTGITPILQIIRAVMRDSKDSVKMSLIFANKTEDDIFLRKELEACREAHPNFSLHYTLDEAPDGWQYDSGYITEDMLRKHMPIDNPSDSLILCCGPPPMVQYACKANLEKCGYPMDNVLTF